MGVKNNELYARDLSEAQWAKSSKSDSGDQCVEVADLGGGAVVARDSINPALSPLRFTAEEWMAFRDGEFG